MQYNNLKRRDSKNVIDSLPLQLAEKQFSLVYLTCMEHERGEEGGWKEDCLELGGWFVEAVEDDWEGE